MHLLERGDYPAMCAARDHRWPLRVLRPIYLPVPRKQQQQQQRQQPQDGAASSSSEEAEEEHGGEEAGGRGDGKRGRSKAGGSATKRRRKLSSKAKETAKVVREMRWLYEGGCVRGIQPTACLLLTNGLQRELR